MSSINDVIKEKFGVNGSNIAETLSKIRPGESGGSGGGGNWLTVNVEETPGQVLTMRFDKTAGEIVNALPFVVFKCMQISDEDGGTDEYSLIMEFGARYEHNVNADGENFFLHTFELGVGRFVCSYDSEYPSYSSDK